MAWVTAVVPVQNEDELVAGPSGRRTDTLREHPVLLLLELLGLTTLAVTQPVLDIFTKGADTFGAEDPGTLGIVAFTLAIALGPALVLWLVDLGAGRIGRRPGRLVHLALLGGLAALSVMVLLKRSTDFGDRRLLACGAVAGGVVLVAAARWLLVRRWLRALSLASAVFALTFLLTPPIDAVAFGREHAAVADPPAERLPPVTVLILDELPVGSLLDGQGRIDAELFPHFARLAAGSSWYRNYRAVSSWTALAVPAMLTGRLPGDPKAVPSYGEHPQNLFTLLGRSHELNVAESWTSLCPPSLCHGDRRALRPRIVGELLGKARDIWWSLVDPRDRPWTFSPDEGLFEGRAERFDAFLRSLRPSGERPALDVAHVVLPHGDWEYLPSGQRYVAPPLEGVDANGWRSDDAARQAHLRFLLQMQYTDHLLGRLLDRMEALGTLDESLLVVAADHGASFREGQPNRAVTAENASDILWAPLFVKAPGQHRGVVRDDEVSSVDIVPTLADHLGVDIPWDVDGRSVRKGRAPSGEDPRVFVLGDVDRLEPRDDGLATVDGPSRFADVYRRRAAPPGRPADLRPFRTGPRGDLVGRRVDQLGLEPAGDVAQLDDPDAFRDVDPDAEVLPVHVSGTVGDPYARSRAADVVVSLNGVVAGWAESYYGYFYTVLPPSLLQDGANDVALWLALETPGRGGGGRP